MSNLTSVNAKMEEEKNRISGRWGSRAGSLSTQRHLQIKDKFVGKREGLNFLIAR